MPSWWQCDFALSERFDLVSNNIDTSLIRRIEFQHSFTIGIAEQRVSKAVDGGSLADTWHSLLSAVWYLAHADDNMGHVSILCNDFQPLNGVAVAHDILKQYWTVLLHPAISVDAAQCRFPLTMASHNSQHRHSWLSREPPCPWLLRTMPF